MSERDTSSPRVAEDGDTTTPYHCLKCGPSRTFSSLESLSSHVETTHICKLLSTVRQLEMDHVDHDLSPIINLFTKESKRLETTLSKQMKDHDNLPKKKRDSILTSSAGYESSKPDRIIATPPSGLYSCTGDFMSARKGLSGSMEHLRFSSGALLCPYNSTSPVRTQPYILRSYANDTRSSETQRDYENKQRALADTLHEARMELDALRRHAADVVESQQRDIENLREQGKLKDLKMESVKDVLERTKEEKRTLQQDLNKATEQNIAHLETVAQLQNTVREKDKTIGLKNEELDSSTAFLKSSTEKETFARDKLEEMTNNLLAQKESLEMKVIEMKKQTDMYRCMLGGVSDVPLELSGNNRYGGGAPFPNPAFIPCGPEVTWLLSSQGQLQQQQQQQTSMAPQVNGDQFATQRGCEVTPNGCQRQAASEPDRHKRRHRPKTTDDSCHGNVRQQPAELTDRCTIARGRSSQCPTFHEAGLNCGRDDGTRYSNDNNSAADRNNTSCPGDVASGQLRTDQATNEQLQKQVRLLQHQLSTMSLKLGRRHGNRRSNDDDTEESSSVDSSLSSPTVTIISGHLVARSSSHTNRSKLTKCRRQVPPVAMTTAKKSLKTPSRASETESAQRRRNALFCTFLRLDTISLCRASCVSRLWRDTSRHPTLWRSVTLKSVTITSQHLKSMSQWCTELRSLTLEGLRPRAKARGETNEQYGAEIRGSLEPGLEALFKAAGDELLSLKIVNCDSVITARCMWLVSCECPHLERLAYTSEVDPVSSEAIWALGAGCRYLTTFIIPPARRKQVFGAQTPMQPSGLNNHAVVMIGRCWSQLRVLCIGGADVSVKGLAAIARQCRHLEVLELCGVPEVDRRIARHMCGVGLEYLQALDFTHTPVTPDAIRHFSDCCDRLVTIMVTVDLNDYCSDSHSEQSHNMAMLEQLKEMEIGQSLRCKLLVKIIKSPAFDRLI